MDLNYKNVLTIIVRNIRFIIFFVSIFALGSISYSLSLPNIYKSSALLKLNDIHGSNQSTLPSSLGSVASLAGINISGSSQSKLSEGIEVLKSRDFLFQFFQDQNIKPYIFAVSKVNKKTGEVIFNDNIYDQDEEKWMLSSSLIEPSMLELYGKFLDENLIIDQDEVTSFVTISIKYVSPKVSQLWADSLIRSLNAKMRAKDKNTATQSVEFLLSEYEKTNIIDLKKILSNLIENEISKISLANSNPEYLFTVIDKPFLPEKKDGPARALICFLVTFLGGLIALLVVLFKELLFDKVTIYPKK